MSTPSITIRIDLPGATPPVISDSAQAEPVSAPPPPVDLSALGVGPGSSAPSDAGSGPPPMLVPDDSGSFTASSAPGPELVDAGFAASTNEPPVPSDDIPGLDAGAPAKTSPAKTAPAKAAPRSAGSKPKPPSGSSRST